MNLEHLKKIDGIMKEMVDTDYVAGVSTLVIKDGKEVYYNEEGYLDKENRIPHKRDSIFRLYSMSKPITAATVMAAMEDGIVDLNQYVGDFIPTFKNQVYFEGDKKVPVKRPMKIKDLLDMQGGLSYGGEGNENFELTSKIDAEAQKRMGTDNEMTTMEFATRLGEVPLLFSPGESFNYSFCADVLGAVIEAATGKTFGKYMHERILDPLGMSDTDFYVPKEKQYRLGKVYEETATGLKEFNANRLSINLKGDHAPKFESGGAGLFSTLDDYAKFAKMLLNNGLYNGVRVLQPGTVKYFTEGDMEAGPKAAMACWDTLGGHSYANLLRVMKEPGKGTFIGSKGEYGWDGWLGAYFANDPAHNLTILSMIQRVDAGTTCYMRKIRNVIFASLED